MKELDLIGNKYNKLTALEKTKKNGRVWYICQCDCGNKTLVETWHLHSGKTKSCGCARRDADKTRANNRKIKYGLANARKVISYYKRNAKRRNIKFDLSEEDCLNLFKQACYYCDREPFNIINSKYSNGEFIYNGIDRIDNSIGYTLSNTVSCCKNCNAMKKDLPKEEFLKIVTLIYNNFNK
jgi:hypothetical protein